VFLPIHPLTIVLVAVHPFINASATDFTIFVLTIVGIIVTETFKTSSMSFIF